VSIAPTRVNTLVGLPFRHGVLRRGQANRNAEFSRQPKVCRSEWRAPPCREILKSIAVGIIAGKETQSREVGLRYSAREQTARPVSVIRAYQVHLATVKKLTPSTCCRVAGALRFLFRVTLKKEWAVAKIPMPKKPLKLPGILSREEVTHFLKSIVSLKHRTILTTIYATGLRISEATHLQPTDIDSQRMMVRVRQGSRWVALLPWRMHWFMYCGVVFHSECASTPGRPWDRLSLHFGGLHLCQRLALARQSIHGLPAGLDQPGLKPLRYRR